MKPKKRQKLCQNCEGEVDLDVIVCPFCAADLREAHDPVKPLYSAPVSSGEEGTLYPHQETARVSLPAPEPIAQEGGAPPRSIFGPTLLFTLGVQSFLIGLLMILFSHKGVVILKWNSHLWFLYVIAGIPMLFFGFKGISKLE
jgi:hypothetical protein